MQSQNIYSGLRDADTGQAVVMCNDEPLDLYWHLKRHASEFDWGYNGSCGPTQLALAILVREFGEEYGLKLYIKFRKEVITYLSDEWAITSEEIRAWYMRGYTHDSRRANRAVTTGISERS